MAEKELEELEYKRLLQWIDHNISCAKGIKVSLENFSRMDMLDNFKIDNREPMRSRIEECRSALLQIEKIIK